MSKDTGGPAFPRTQWPNETGMTLRDYFAAKAMQGLLAGLDREARRFIERDPEPAATMSKACYSMADAMLKAREA
jgi:hypothetical protein